MGQRANLVVVKGGDWKLYYDHWCANRLDMELFWGPIWATEFIEQRSPLDDRTDWLDEIWCEGAAIIDHDRRVVVWYGGEDIQYDVPSRRAFVALMQRQWPGWEIRWATGAITDIGRYLHIPLDRFLARSDTKREGSFGVWPEEPDYNNVLLTVKEGGFTSAARILGDEESLEAGAGQLSSLTAFPRTSEFTWTGSMPTLGLHLDLDQRDLWYWNAYPAEFIEDRVQQTWPGWRTQWLHDRFEEHLRIASVEIRLPVRGAAELHAELIERLRRSFDHPASNPARKLGPRLGATNINPWTDEARGSVGSPAEKLRILDAIQDASCA